MSKCYLVECAVENGREELKVLHRTDSLAAMDLFTLDYEGNLQCVDGDNGYVDRYLIYCRDSNNIFVLDTVLGEKSNELVSDLRAAAKYRLDNGNIKGRECVTNIKKICTEFSRKIGESKNADSMFEFARNYFVNSFHTSDDDANNFGVWCEILKGCSSGFKSDGEPLYVSYFRLRNIFSCMSAIGYFNSSVEGYERFYKWRCSKVDAFLGMITDKNQISFGDYYNPEEDGKHGSTRR